MKRKGNLTNNGIPNLKYRVLEREEVVDGEAAVRYNKACDYPLTSDYVIVAAEIASRRDVRGLSVLEIGPGPGNLMLELLRIGAAKLFGMDPSNVMTKYANQRFESLGMNGQFIVVQESIYELPKSYEGAFDIVVSMNTFHQLARPETALEQMVLAAKPGGLVFIKDFRRDIPPERLIERANYTKPEIRGDLIASIRAAISKDEFRRMLREIPGISFSVTDAVAPSGLSKEVRDAIKRDPVPHHLDYLISQVVELHK